MVEIFQTLWIGEKLSVLEKLCLSSWIKNNCLIHLYTYNNIGDVPSGVIVKDGNTIVPEKDIFYYKNGSVSAFSNFFRFTLLLKHGGVWVDIDLLCISRDFNQFVTGKKYIFGGETTSSYQRTLPSSFLIKLPKGSEVAKKAVEIQHKHKKKILNGEMTWGSGPQTISAIIKEFKLEKYILDWKETTTCGFFDVESLVKTTHQTNKNCILRPENIHPETKVIHLWNECWRRSKMDKNADFDPKSIIEYYKGQYLKYRIKI
tara:strand:- start:506 stop:1285 length:780 start_codon:yes stop_codon:yes gene_type:complete